MDAMTTSETTMRRTRALLPGAHRVVRRLGAGEGPFPGVLVADGDSMAVLRDAEGLAGWGGWSLAGARHVAAPLDVVRRVDGHDVLLPWCTEKVAVFLGRRAGQGSALSGGEVSTLAVSLLRGIGELGVDPTDARSGEWWLTDAGCPVLVIGEEEDARIAAAVLLETAASESADRVQRRVLEAVAEGLRRHSERPEVPRRQIDAWESELLSVAAPRPLVSADDTEGSGAPSSAGREIGALRAAVTDRPQGRVTRAEDGRRGRRHPRARAPRGEGVVAVVRAAAARGLSAVRGLPLPTRAAASVGTGGADRQRPREGDRRRMPKLAVGLAAAGAVLAAGLLWPSDSGGQADEPTVGRGVAPAESDGGGASLLPTDSPTTAAGSSPDAVPPGPNDQDHPLAHGAGDRPVSVIEDEAARLVAVIRDCAVADDRSCAGAVVAGADHVVELFQSSPDDARPSGGEESIALVDDYGGAVVVRLSAGGDGVGGGDAGAGGAGVAGYDRMLVLVRMDEKWLVRDAYDVADQPG
ncbi:hypothetical protein [Microbacterium sp. GCS4]|uniref:hypothetical protein n=1 Tax=Microbacterium sp. GCS4 TaxID=1692239 RepID=UPI00068191CE|nr:hypothetical protein [Microbacterium sp. GCS4]